METNQIVWAGVLLVLCFCVFRFILRRPKDKVVQENQPMQENQSKDENKSYFGEIEYKCFYYKDYPDTAFNSSPQLASDAALEWVAKNAIIDGAVLIDDQKHVGIKGYPSQFCQFDKEGYLEVSYRKINE